MKNNTQSALNTNNIKCGVISSYVHPGSRLGVLVEVKCESDITARTEDFQNLVGAVALQIAATGPRFICRDDVTDEALAKARESVRQRALDEGKPETMITRLVAAHAQKFHEEFCLYEQPFIKDKAIKVHELIEACMARLGETIRVTRFVCMHLGDMSAELIIAPNLTMETSR